MKPTNVGMGQLFRANCRYPLAQSAQVVLYHLSYNIVRLCTICPCDQNAKHAGKSPPKEVKATTINKGNLFNNVP
jgi:hypothetical protein